ncbi:hypothetical protein [Cellulosilyticum sp. I15G10I2]|uniref:hypothetical protein n=1 Tax=Cellulosilyticum sp. I15G10I2 TaxID=1892843 RepID=UPI00085C7040|nr:hypothetical protein [Cellulosilyticum sp. I15G10I2]
MGGFWNSLSTTEQLELIKQIVPTLSIVIGAIISFSIFSLTKRKETNFKVHEQRKIKYENYLSIFQKVLANADLFEKGEIPFDKEEWMEMQIGVIIYGSDKVIKKIVEMNEFSRNEESYDKNLLILKLGELMHLMRKEVGLSNKEVSIRDSLSFFITDIKDEKFDYLFTNFK